MTVTKIKAILTSMGLSTEGSKEVLLARLKKAQEEALMNGEPTAEATPNPNSNTRRIRVTRTNRTRTNSAFILNDEFIIAAAGCMEFGILFHHQLYNKNIEITLSTDPDTGEVRETPSGLTLASLSSMDENEAFQKELSKSLATQLVAQRFLSEE